MSIDTHIHLFHRGLPRTVRPRHDPVYDATLGVLRAHAAPCGVSRFVVVQPSFLGCDNTYLLQQIAENPAHLRGVAVLDPATPGSGIEALLVAGVTGIRLNLLGTDLEQSLGEKQLDLVSRCADRGMSVELHDVCERLPGVLGKILPRSSRIVVDHFGRPDVHAGGIEAPAFRQLMALGGRHEIYVKISAPYRSPGLQARETFAALLDALGVDRLLWGSDWPWTQHEREIDYAAWCCPFGSGSLAERLAPAAAALYGFPLQAAVPG